MNRRSEAIMVLALAAILAAMVALLVVKLTTAKRASPPYRLTDLTASGVPNATAFNDTGQVVGGDGQAFIWDKDKGITYLGTPAGGYSRAQAVNNRGQVAGWYRTMVGSHRAFFWDDANGMVDLGTLAGKSSYAMAINDAGQVVGHAETTTNRYQAFFWEQKTGMIHIGAARQKSGSYCIANDVSNAGKVVGKASPYPFLWDKTNGMVDLNSPGRITCSANAINDADQIVGTCMAGKNKYHIILWDNPNHFRDLGPIGKGNVEICAINETGQFVGHISRVSILGERQHSFLWSEETGFVLLDDLLGRSSEWRSLTTALDINNRGQILGLGETADRQWHVFLLTPMPAAAEQ
jgi:probable HAF family extracellular repeat protein